MTDQERRDEINRHRHLIREARELAERVKTYENVVNLQRLERDHKALYTPLRLVKTEE